MPYLKRQWCCVLLSTQWLIQNSIKIPLNHTKKRHVPQINGDFLRMCSNVCVCLIHFERKSYNSFLCDHIVNDDKVEIFDKYESPFSFGRQMSSGKWLIRVCWLNLYWNNSNLFAFAVIMSHSFGMFSLYTKWYSCFFYFVSLSLYLCYLAFSSFFSVRLPFSFQPMHMD